MKESDFFADFTQTGSDRLYTEQNGSGFVTEENAAVIPRLQPRELNSSFLPVWWYKNRSITEILQTDRGCAVKPCPFLLPDEVTSRYFPLVYTCDVSCSSESGNIYLVTVTLCGSDILYGDKETDVLLFSGRRRLVWKGTLLKGEEKTITFSADISPIIPRGKTAAESDTRLTITLISNSAYLTSITAINASSLDCRRILIAGDSTVADQSADVPYAPSTCYCGWGQMLTAFIGTRWCVSNHAHSGLTTESFRTEGHYEILKTIAQQGDMCLIQFAHNDQKRPHLQPYDGYTIRLKEYIHELQEKGVKPVLVTPIARNSWNSDGTYNDHLKEYADACISLADEKNLSLIDLHAFSMDIIKKTGLEASKKWFYPSDYTHTNDYGGFYMASFIASELHRLGLIQEVQQQEDWIPVSLPQLNSPVEKTDSSGNSIENDKNTTINKASQIERPDDVLTRVDALDFVINAMRFFPVNVYNDGFKDVIGHETYAGIVQCASQNDLIPPSFIEDEKLYPDRPVTLKEFLLILISGYSRRRTLQPVSDPMLHIPEPYRNAVRLAAGCGLISQDAKLDKILTREEADSICRNSKI